MNPFRPLEYLFYRIYDWNLRTWGKADAPQFNASLAVLFLLMLNVYLIIDLIRLVTGRHVPFEGVAPAAILFFVLFSVNYFLLVRNRRYEKIADKFAGESKTKRRVNLALSVLYVVLTFVCAFGLPYLLR